MRHPQPPPAHVYAVHVTRPGNEHVGAMEVVFAEEAAAHQLAQDWSTDELVAYTEVTRFALGEMGTRKAVAWYLHGLRNGRVNGRVEPWKSRHQPPAAHHAGP